MHKDINKSAVNRLKRIRDQNRGFKKWSQNEKCCVNIIHQSFTVKSDLSGVEDIILQNHLVTHAARQIKPAPGQSHKRNNPDLPDI
ncbi:MAG: hypothetical protein A3J48_00070 [Candidatus Doudnabacteria bacterium RIFCSPHIGHO2_02_FULL_46_11]|uniref:Uncharacterized protein n=1 Tax=Candidatus Doudnabacteria bacterium RIFCSPHIGHO2_02_FULL_46_11 TaxID=1817832 RepID=A0A1F5P996_9BACT|nr:MAG: hypothetical protein A3J48_00070 [Candidatus Doudnabacteria bacterium RIFCSPHIGHO2_02_FULL_46_11]